MRRVFFGGGLFLTDSSNPCLAGLGNLGRFTSEHSTGLGQQAQIPQLCSQITKQMADWHPEKLPVGQGRLKQR